jgi:hypothetical protein
MGCSSDMATSIALLISSTRHCAVTIGPPGSPKGQTYMSPCTVFSAHRISTALYCSVSKAAKSRSLRSAFLNCVPVSLRTLNISRSLPMSSLTMASVPCVLCLVSYRDKPSLRMSTSSDIDKPLLELGLGVLVCFDRDMAVN